MLGLIGDTGHLETNSNISIVKNRGNDLASCSTVIMHALDAPSKYTEELILLGFAAAEMRVRDVYIIASAEFFDQWFELAKLMRGNRVFVISSPNTKETYKYINNIYVLKSSIEHLFYQGLCRHHLGSIVSTKTRLGNYEVDFMFPLSNLVIEVNGTDLAYNIKKDRVLLQLGYSCLHFTELEITSHLKSSIMEVKNIINSRRLD